MLPAEIEGIVAAQREHFSSGATLPVAARRRALVALRDAIRAHEKDINEALLADLGKSRMEVYLTEVGMTLSEIGFQLKHLARWARPRRVRTGLGNLPGKSCVCPEPYGVVLVMSPWNYPFQLAMEPLVGALAAGNCCVVKPSNYSPATSGVLRTIIGEALEPGLASVVLGGREENAALLDQEFDYIFFTGGPTVGQLVLHKAADHLTPVTLELGGKSPCIVTRSADVAMAARRIAFGKFLNCGQTCVAVDYVLVDEAVHDELLLELCRQTRLMYGADPLTNPNWGRMVNKKHFSRVMDLVGASADRVVLGGSGNEATLQIEPTIVDGVTAADPLMGEEIFGPVLPIITVASLAEAEDFVRARPKPLALYLFTSSRDDEDRILGHVSFGGGCVNDTIVHLATSEMGFGGVGRSGMGSYHGYESFRTFSHFKSVLKRGTWPDVPLRYAPYSDAKLGLIRRVMR